ncbi:MAG: hypothetical protein KDC87_07500 [Planctomycetes bacterium]|nr:hypothetical protein [Planctomycetota bacterium]
MRNLLVPLVVSCACAASGLAAQRTGSDTVVTGGTVVHHDTGRAVAGAEVLVVPRPFPGLPRPLQRYLLHEPASGTTILRTDARGRFRVHVPLGDEVAFLARHGGKASVLSPAVVAGSFVELRLWGTREVSGTLRNRRDRTPLANHPITVYLPSDGSEEFGFHWARRTDAAGHYRVAVPLGTWVKVAARGDGWLAEAVVHDNPHNDLWVEPGVPHRLVDPFGRPLPNVWVVDDREPRMRALTDARGQFVLCPGDARPRWVHAYVPGNHAAQLLLLAAQRDRASILGNTIRLRLVDRRGRPLTGVRVVTAAMAQKPDQELVRNFLVPRLSRTGPDGQLSVAVRKGCLVLALFVEVRGRWCCVYRGAPQASGAAQLVVDPSATWCGTIRGADRLPVGETVVHLVRLPDDHSQLAPPALSRPIAGLPLSVTATTERGGRVRFSGLQPGRYLLALHAERHLPFHRFLPLQIGTQRQVVTIPRGLALTAVLRSGNRPASPEARAWLNPISALAAGDFPKWVRIRFPLLARASPDAQGRALFLGLPAGRMRVRAEQGSRRAFRDVSLERTSKSVHLDLVGN